MIPCGVSGAHGRVHLDKDSQHVLRLSFCVHILSQAVTPHRLCAPSFHARAVARTMASLGHPRRFQTEEELDLVCHFLGLATSGFVEGIFVSSLPLGVLRRGEFVLFTSYISSDWR